MKKFIIPLLFCFLTASCHKRPEIESSNRSKSEEDFVSMDFFNLTDREEKNIIKYIKACDDHPAHYAIPVKEMNLEIFLLRRYLEASGYKNVDDRIFNERINQIFEVNKRREKGEYEVIDRAQFFYISFQNYENYSGLPTYEKLYVINNEDIQSSDRLAFMRDYNIIIIPRPMSKFFDPFEREYNERELQPYPEEFLMHLHLNKYLFNDDQLSLTWLLKKHKEIFLRFVRVYGYDKEPEINKLVLNEILEAYNRYREYGLNYKSVLNNLFAAKDCNGNLQIREGLLKYILEVTTEEENDLFAMLDDYCHFMLCSTPEESGFTQSEMFKIIAFTGYYTESAYIKNNIRGRWTDGNWDERSTFYNEITARGALWEEIKENDYYGLPGFENIIER